MLSVQQINELATVLWDEHVFSQCEDFSDLQQMILVNFLYLDQQGTPCVVAGGLKWCMLKSEIELQRRAR